MAKIDLEVSSSCSVIPDISIENPIDPAVCWVSRVRQKASGRIEQTKKIG